MKNKRIYLLFAVTSLFLFEGIGSFAQTVGTSDFTYRCGETIEESVLPATPQAASVSGYFSTEFSYSTGSAQIDIPIYTLAGHELSIPIGLRYSGGSGIKLDEVAGVAGLGWTLEAGGCVSRTVCDMPDEFSSLDITHSMPGGTLLSNLTGDVNNTSTLSYLTSVCRHKVDSRLDRYSYNVCGLSGSFVITDAGVVQLSGDGVLINAVMGEDGAIESFIITGPDGTRYTLGEKETGTHDGTSGNPNISPLTGAKDLWSATTAWYLTKMESRTGLETATFMYKNGLQWDRTVAVRSQSRTFVTGAVDQPEMSESISDIIQRYDTKLLTSVSLNGYAVNFSYAESRTRTGHTGITQWNYPARLTGVSVRRPDGQTLRSVTVGTEREANDGRVILSRLEFRDSAGSLDDIWRFTYNTLTESVSHCAQDWYGYYNGAESGYNGICPFSFNPTQRVTAGAPDAGKASYMALKTSDHDGAKQTYIYDGASSGSGAAAPTVGVRVKNILIGDTGLYRTFTYENPAADGPVEPGLDMYLTVRAPYSTGDMTGSLGTQTVTWTFTIHETPVVSGPSIRDTRVYYGKVTELVHTMTVNAPQRTKTVRYYDTSEAGREETDVFSRFPSAVRTNYANHPPYGTDLSPYTGIRQYYTDSGPARPPLLSRQEEYAWDADSSEFRKVSETAFEYAGAGAEREVLVSYEAGQVWYPTGIGNISYPYIYHYPVYAKSYSGRNAVTKRIVNYYHTDTERNAADDQSSDEDADDGEDADTALNRDSVCVVMTYYDRDTALTLPSRLKSSGVTEGSVERRLEYTYPADTSVLYSQHAVSTLLQTDYRINHPTVTVKPGLLKRAISFPKPVYNPSSKTIRSEKTEYSWFTLAGTGRRVCLPHRHTEYYDGKQCWSETVSARDSRGNVSEYRQTGGPLTSLIWSYDGEYPVIRIENCGIDTVRTHLADRGLQVDSITAAAAQSRSSLLVCRSLLSHFTDAHITTYTYERGIGLSSISDPASCSTSFEYDASGRLSLIRDNNGNKVTEYEYRLLVGDEEDSSSDLIATSDGCRSIRTRTYTDEGGVNCAESVSWWNLLGLHRQDIRLNCTDDGKDAVFNFGSDLLLHDDAYEYLPYAVAGTEGQFQTDAATRSGSYNSSDKPYTARHYESSVRGKVLTTALPGFDGEHETLYFESAATAFPEYVWYKGDVRNVGTYTDTQIIRSVTTDADGRRKAVYRDHFGKTLATSAVRTDGSEDTTYYIYDPYDNLCAVIGGGLSVDTADRNFWRYTYDTLGRLSSRGIPGSGEVTSYTYDSENRVIAQTQGAAVKEYEYDAFGRVTKIYFTGENTGRQLFEQHCYDSYPAYVDSTFSVTPAWGGAYKGLESYTKLAEIEPTDTLAGYTQIYNEYDRKGQLVRRQMKYSDGTKTSRTFDYDFRGNIIGIETKFFTESWESASYCLQENRCYDLETRLIASTERLIISAEQKSRLLSSTYAYDLQGRRTSVATTIDAATPFTVTESLSYNLQGWLEGIRYKTGASVLYEEDLDYYSNTAVGCPASYSGRITRRSETGLKGSSLSRYAYDYAGRLVRATPYSFEYDSRSNLLTITNGTSSVAEYSYEGDLLGSLDLGAGAYTFAYDGKGRLTRDFTPFGGGEMKYSDYVNRVNDTKAASYCYLADGGKFSSLKKNSGEALIYRGPFIFRKSGATWVLEGIVCEDGKVTLDGAYVYLKDHLGSIVGVVGADDQWVEASSYNPYGGRILLQNAASTGFREHFTGKEDQKVDFGIDYTDFGARLYSPVIRRWATPDPKSEDRYGVSPYAYCAGDPVNFVDPDGNDWYSYEKTIENEDGEARIETLYAWTDATSQEELDKLGIKGIYLDKAIVVFYGSEDEKLSEDGFLNKAGSKTATVVVYGPDGAGDVKEYVGYTMSSNPKKFGVIANGVYDVRRTNLHGALDLEWAINEKGKVPSLYGYNPAFPERKDGYLDNVYVHRSNWSGKAGYNEKNGQAVSKGCLLILGSQWKEFSRQLESVKMFKLILTR